MDKDLVQQAWIMVAHSKGSSSSSNSGEGATGMKVCGVNLSINCSARGEGLRAATTTMTRGTTVIRDLVESVRGQ